MKTLALALSALVLVAAGWVGFGERYTFQEGSRVWVTGTSTLHDWECEAEQLAGTLAADPGGAALGSLSELSVVVPVQAIECGNGTMNGKLRDAFDVRANPTIRFDLASAEVVPGSGDRFTVRATGRLTMAGAVRPVTLEADGQALASGRYRFTGAVPLEMTAFGMKPPTAMLGTLKTGDRVVVHYDVTVGS
ncbi:MAG: YceI family protein [Rhodothermales bacterium]|nr:YceI family protein [Rhodothermales bacterium]